MDNQLEDIVGSVTFTLIFKRNPRHSIVDNGYLNVDKQCTKYYMNE